MADVEGYSSSEDDEELYCQFISYLSKEQQADGGGLLPAMMRRRRRYRAELKMSGGLHTITSA